MSHVVFKKFRRVGFSGPDPSRSPRKACGTSKCMMHKFLCNISNMDFYEKKVQYTFPYEYKRLQPPPFAVVDIQWTFFKEQLLFSNMPVP